MQQHHRNCERQGHPAVNTHLAVNKKELLCPLPNGKVAALQENVREPSQRVDKEEGEQQQGRVCMEISRSEALRVRLPYERRLVRSELIPIGHVAY